MPTTQLSYLDELNQHLGITPVTIGGGPVFFRSGYYRIGILDQTFTITVDGFSNNYLDHCVVKMINEGGEESGPIALTNGQGRFNLPSGLYTIRVE